MSADQLFECTTVTVQLYACYQGLIDARLGGAVSHARLLAGSTTNWRGNPNPSSTATDRYPIDDRYPDRHQAGLAMPGTLLSVPRQHRSAPAPYAARNKP